MVVVQRRAPDAMGARMVMVPFENIEGLKLTEVIDAHALEPLGIYKSASKLATPPQETIEPISQKVERTLDALTVR